MGKAVIFAAAGAGKTERIIQEALAISGRRVLITTYTNRNAQQITDRLIDECGLVPSSIQVGTWFRFLLRDAVKPYQSALTIPFRTQSINFVGDRPRYAPKSRVDTFYFDDGSNLYKDTVADIACAINKQSDGKTIRRLEQLFDLILIDEMQDLVGYDLVFIDTLIGSQIDILMVGDPRQSTYASNDSPKNKQYRGFGLYAWVEQRCKKGSLCVGHMNWSHRCNDSICRFGDALFPEQPRTEARNTVSTSHDGVFLVKPEHLQEYTNTFKPMVLRWNRRSRVADYLLAGSCNIGDVKGCTFDRVLVYPTQPMLKYLRTADPRDAGERERLYVAATRARYSVAFVMSGSESKSTIATRWEPNK